MRARILASTFETPIGPMACGVDRQGSVVGTVLPRPGLGEKELLARLATDGERPIEDEGATSELRRQLREYFSGERTSFDLPLALRGTEFQVRVWSALRGIPYGETRSYGEIAEEIASPGAARAVGQANHRNPIPILVPCHRVVGADGSLTGFGGGLETKEWLLERESGRREVRSGS